MIKLAVGDKVMICSLTDLGAIRAYAHNDRVDLGPYEIEAVSQTIDDVKLYGIYGYWSARRFIRASKAMAVKPAQAIAAAQPMRAECGACGAGFNETVLSGQYFYPVQFGLSSTDEQIKLCPACAKSTAEHIQYLKVNHGPTRTGRT